MHATAPAPAPPSAALHSPGRATFERAIACWNAGDLDGYLEMYDPAIVLHGYGDSDLDHAGVVATYRGLWEALSDIRLEVHDVFEEGEHLTCRATLQGRHTGPLFGVAPTDRSISQNVITILRFADGRCVERWSVADTLAVLLQIGAVSLPG